MKIKTIHYGIIIMSLILLFAIIHFGVGIGIVATNRGYGDMFRPELGLAAYNIIISLIGFVVGGLGLFCILTNHYSLGKIVSLISIVLAIFTLASLITALIINSNAVIYVSGRYANNMKQYLSDSNTRRIIDGIQSSYGCCGEAAWYDWARFLPVATSASTSTTTVIPVVVATTTPSAAVTTTILQVATTSTPSAVATTSVAPAAATTTVVPAAATTTVAPAVATTTVAPAAATTTVASAAVTTTVVSARMARNARRDINFFDPLPNPLVLAIRRRRQASSTSTNVTMGPYTTQFYIPTTCCMKGASSSTGSSQSTCTSSGQYYTNGCLKYIAKRVNNQDMGIGIINCFLFVLALVAIPLLLLDYSTSNSHGQDIPRHHVEHMKQLNPNNPKSRAVIDSYH